MRGESNVIDAAGELERVAARQWGMFTTGQARQVSQELDEDVLQSDRIGAVPGLVPGVFTLPGIASPAHPTPRTYARWLALVPDVPPEEGAAKSAVVISHWSAARLWGLSADSGQVLHVTWLRGEPAQLPDGAQPVQSYTGTVVDAVELNGMFVTTPLRTLDDLLAVGPADAVDLGRVVERILDQRLAGEEQVAVVIARHGGGTGSVEELLLAARTGR